LGRTEYIRKGSIVMPLTDVSIKALKPREVRYLVTDSRGLCLEVLPSGKLSWLYRYRFRGKPEKVAFGRYPDMRLKSARQQRDKLVAQLMSGESPAAQKQLAKSAVSSHCTMRDFAERYYRDVVVRNRTKRMPPRARLRLEPCVFLPLFRTLPSQSSSRAKRRSSRWRKRFLHFRQFSPYRIVGQTDPLKRRPRISAEGTNQLGNA
jgi:hypothetical protein